MQQVHAEVDDQRFVLGYRAVNSDGKEMILTLSEIEELRKNTEVVDSENRTFILDIIVKIQDGQLVKPDAISDSFAQELEGFGVKVANLK